MEATNALPLRRTRRRNSALFHGWVTSLLQGMVRGVSSFVYVVGVLALLLSDIFLGGSVLERVFLHTDGIEAWLIPWGLSIATAAAQMGLWALVFEQGKDKSVLRRIVSIIGAVAALLLSIADTLVDALYSQVLILGTNPTDLIPAGMGFNIFGLVFVLFAMISFFGEPIALFLLFANKDQQTDTEEV